LAEGVSDRLSLSPKCSSEVFILGLKVTSSTSGISNNINLIGTAFAVTKKHSSIAAHNLLDESTQQPLINEPWQVDRKGKKVQDGVRFDNPMDMRVESLNVSKDWAILEIIDSARYC